MTASAVLSFRSDDPDAATERIALLAPGVRVAASTARGFDIRVRARACGGSAFVEYAAAEGHAVFPEDHSYVVLTMALAGGFECRTGRRSLQLTHGEVSLLSAGVSGEILPHGRPHMLGINLDSALLEAHRANWDPDRQEGSPWPDRVRSRTDAGRRLSGYLERVLRELPWPNSLLYSPLAAGEAEDILAALVAEACRAPRAAPAPRASDALGARSEELLAARLEQAVSLAEVARDLGTSVRTLCRTFRDRRRMGPMAFLRRQRLEAARRDLFAAEPGELQVTDVALRYGFAHFGRFAVDYRQSFGESPSATLRA